MPSTLSGGQGSTTSIGGGELRIVDPPLVIDTAVESAQPIAAGAGGSLDSQVSKEVAIACLLTPDQPHGVREIGRYIDRAPSAVSNAMAGLRDDGLLTSEGEAMVPDLFHELLAVWRRRAVSLAALPDPRARSAKPLGLGLDEPEETMGWALTDTLAAASWGMPIVARGDHPPDFYVPSESELRAARSVLGEASDTNARVCTVAVAPVRLACFRRHDHSATTGERWPVANHIVVALDIAQDRARGLEALEQWQPEGIVACLVIPSSLLVTAVGGSGRSFAALGRFPRRTKVGGRRRGSPSTSGSPTCIALPTTSTP